MEDIILPSRPKLAGTSEDYLTPTAPSPQVADHSSTNLPLRTAEDALKGLQSKPNIEFLTQILQWLRSTTSSKDSFNINVPGPQAARVINVLVNQTVPDFWDALGTDNAVLRSRGRQLMAGCLTSAAGIGALIARLRSLIFDHKSTQSSTLLKSSPKTSRSIQPLRDILGLLEVILQKKYFVASLRKGIHVWIAKPTQQTLLWKEVVSTLAAGKLLSVAAEANAVINDSSDSIEDGSWIGKGQLYATWLGKNIRYMVVSENDNSVEKAKEVTRILGTALTLGYTDVVIDTVFVEPLAKGHADVKEYRSLLQSMAIHEQKTILQAIIRVMSMKHMPKGEDTEDEPMEQAKKTAIGGAAAFLAFLTNDDICLRDFLVGWLTAPSGDNVAVDGNMRRAVIATVASDHEIMEKTLQKLLNIFGDKLYIKHTPVLHQEVNAQILLLVAGRVSRSSHNFLATLARSSAYINAISSRLAASSIRSRFLGMIVGTAISELVDPKDKRMTFSAEEIETTEGQWYRDLVNVSDNIGDIGDLKAVSPKFGDFSTKTPNEAAKNGKKVSVNLGTTSKIISIEEVYYESEDEDEDIPVYEKPDSDREDEDDDPTLIQRNKPTAPVYIRDLIAGLRDTENYERHKLALLTASSLIRRKANFGTEVSDHVEELATLLTGLGDKYSIESFQQLRLQGMIAVMVARPLQMGQWFSKTYFNGDYSISQRASILTTLTMGARELAGFKEEDAGLTGSNLLPEHSFPSKRLPEKLHKLYTLEAAPVNSLTQKLERMMIRPMAAEAADKLTGPKALKVRTFSSRMEVEKKRKKAIPNELAKIVADGIFFPLAGRWRIHLQSYGDRSTHTSPFLQAHFLKSLSLLLYASGPSTLSLPQMTAEFWSLLLSMRTAALGDVAILEALLFAFLTLLDVNEDKHRIAEEHAKELLETQAWAEGVFERIGGGSEEGERVRMLAAGILVGTGEVVEKYQRLLVGDLVNFM